MRRVRASLYERARHFVKKCKVERLLASEGIVGPWADSYEMLQTLVSIRALLPVTPPVLIDVGAHKGAFTRAAEKVLGFETIVCVEPDVDLAEELEGAVPGGKTEIHHVALSERVGTAALHIHGDRSMNSLLESDPDILRAKFRADRPELVTDRTVATTTLDRLLTERGTLDGRNLFLKLDTQGNELNILRGGENTLRSTAACLVEFMFCTPYATSYSFAELIDFMSDAELTCRGALNITRRRSHEVSAVDFLFSR